MLYKKELSTVPVGKMPQIDANGHSYVATAKVVELKRSGKILVVDFFDSKKKALFHDSARTAKIIAQGTKRPAMCGRSRTPGYGWGIMHLQTAKRIGRSQKSFCDMTSTICFPSSIISLANSGGIVGRKPMTAKRRSGSSTLQCTPSFRTTSKVTAKTTYLPHTYSFPHWIKKGTAKDGAVVAIQSLKHPRRHDPDSAQAARFADGLPCIVGHGSQARSRTRQRSAFLPGSMVKSCSGG